MGHSLRTTPPPSRSAEPAHLHAYRELGYAVIKGVFDPEEVRELARAFDRVYARGIAYPKSFRHQNVYFRVASDERLGRVLRFAQWPCYYDETLDRFRRDRRMLEIVAPLIGKDIRQVVNQLNWKPAGAAMADFGFHQDIRFRRPREAYRRPRSSYVQTAIAVDPHRPESGAMKLYPGSHRLGALSFPLRERVMDRALCEEDISAVGLDPGKLVDLVLDPGDVAIWNLYTVHGSGPNTAQADRRVYINGFASARDCDRGEWTFRDGEPCTLGEPVLVHYEDLYRRPEPHFVDE